MLNYEEVCHHLADRNLKKVARAVGLAYRTVWTVSKGDAKEVSYETVKRLSDYIEGRMIVQPLTGADLLEGDEE